MPRHPRSGGNSQNHRARVPHRPGRGPGRTLSAALIAAAATIVAALIGYAGAWVPQRDAPAPAVSPTPVATATRTHTPPARTQPTKAPPRRTPKADCTWHGEGRCRATSGVDPTGSVSECGGSGKQGGGRCSVSVD